MGAGAVAPRTGASCPGASGATPVPFTEGVAQAVNRAYQDELRAQATYDKAIADHGAARPFQRIAFSEARHAWLVRGLYSSRGLEPPKSAWSAAAVPSYKTMQAACAAGVAIETENVAMYDQLLARTDLPPDVRNVFERLRAMSQNRHLPAFRSCAP